MPHDHANHDSRRLVTRKRTARRYGEKCDRTITRWVNDPELGFPQPVKINGRLYFVGAELDEFDRRLAAGRLHDMAGRHQAEDQIKHAQCDLAGSNRSADKKKAHCAGGEA